uniref:Uncharacterized protein n=1 Tax=Anguilla anguilla TaxID=7936 RepID=A0A0E9U5B7_ANGAN
MLVSHLTVTAQPLRGPANLCFCEQGFRQYCRLLPVPL